MATSPPTRQIDPSPVVIESGPLPPTGPPVAKTWAVGAVCADAPVARSNATMDRLILPYSMRSLLLNEGSLLRAASSNNINS
jgi:hypothetical protein